MQIKGRSHLISLIFLISGPQMRPCKELRCLIVVCVAVRPTGDSAVVGGEDERQGETGQQGRGEMSPSHGRQIRTGNKPAIKVALWGVMTARYRV